MVFPLVSSLIEDSKFTSLFWAAFQHDLGSKLCLSPRYIVPYQIIGQVSEVEYRLILPPLLSRLHDVFHISEFQRFVPKSL